MAKKITAENHHIDQQIGQRIREIRVARGLSQEKVGDAMGLTFQQVQKYEKGSNRLSGSRMVALCQLFEVTPNEIMGINGDSSKPVQQLSAHGIRVAQMYEKLDNPQKRAVNVMLAAFLGENDEGENRTPALT